MGNTKAFALNDWTQAIQLAQAAGIDAFALNMANNDSTNDMALPLAFTAANNLGFKKCQCGPNPADRVMAYTTNNDPKYGTARINLCPLYFITDTLDTVMENAKTDNPVEKYANLATYSENQGRVWFHELSHIDWASGAYWTSNGIAHVTYVLMYADFRDGTKNWMKAYRPQGTKALARWQHNAGQWIQRNSDSLTLFALAKYVQKTLGNIYPHLPLAPRPPTRVGDGVDFTGIFTMVSDGKAELPANTTLSDELEWTPNQGTCATVDDNDGALDLSAAVVTGSQDYYSHQGCINYNAGNFDVKDWVAVSCGY